MVDCRWEQAAHQQNNSKTPRLGPALLGPSQYVPAQGGKSAAIEQEPEIRGLLKWQQADREENADRLRQPDSIASVRKKKVNSICRPTQPHQVGRTPEVISEIPAGEVNEQDEQAANKKKSQRQSNQKQATDHSGSHPTGYITLPRL